MPPQLRGIRRAVAVEQHADRAHLVTDEIERLAAERVARAQLAHAPAGGLEVGAGEDAAEVTEVEGGLGELLVERAHHRALGPERLQQRGEEPLEGLLQALARFERLFEEIVDRA